ncbi:CPBP family intramembrane glutamic endopeptidase [Deinococcus pimensis]|uniref:CPBP family intramembrane glutamic endopeptidase n=1 Tax=Deinococcus pimensis TaxID=309888 RepID=UPI0004B46E81|nr:CPBP family intramembrane glutamic endopeptidase [Deinococcus pimensis]
MNWTTTATVVALCVPGIALGIPPMLDNLVARAPNPQGKPLPPRRVLLTAGIAQSMVLVLGAAVLGSLLGPRVGLGALVTPALGTNPGAALALAVLGSAAFLALYYGVFRPWLDPVTLGASEGFRKDTGLTTRVLYGGVVEEVLLRWGVQSLLAWLLSLVLGAGVLAHWTAILVAGLLFAVGHVPAYLAAGCRRTPAFFTTVLVLNTLLALFYGFLYWQFGLAAAILAHAVTHLMWYPMDLRVWNTPRAA